VNLTISRLRSVTGLLAVCAALFGPMSPRAADSPSLEYQVKAAFLVKLAMFVEWPAKAFASPEAPIRIGILGRSPFGKDFDEVAAKERINGRRLEVRVATDIAGLRECHIVFIAQSEQGRLAEIKAAVAGQPVLTVGDHPEFAQDGGMVNFIKEDGRVRFEVNRAAADKVGLRLSSKLLQVARVVNTAQLSGRTGG
jgi:hypothetical protein